MSSRVPVEQLNKEQLLEQTLREVRETLSGARSRPGQGQLMYEEAVTLALRIINNAETSRFLRRRRNSNDR